MFIKARSRPTMVPLKQAPHAVRGILSLAPFRGSTTADPENVQSFEFLSGGYDKTVQYWRVTYRVGSSERSRFSSRFSPITKGYLNSKVSALLQLPAASRVLAGAGQRLWSLDPEHRTPQSAIHFSNLINQLHAPSKKNPNIFIAEVRADATDPEGALKRLNIFSGGPFVRPGTSTRLAYIAGQAGPRIWACRFCGGSICTFSQAPGGFTRKVLRARIPGRYGLSVGLS